jgi:hypothetical protein
MNPNQLAEDLSRRKTWEDAESRLIDLLTDVSSGLNNYERRHDGFVVSLDGMLKPVLVPYRAGGKAPAAPPPAPEPPAAAKETPGEPLEGFQESEAGEAPERRLEPAPKRPKVITVPRPEPKTSPTEMMMSLGSGLTIRYDKHIREVIRFVLGPHYAEHALDEAVNVSLSQWLDHFKARLPR